VKLPSIAGDTAADFHLVMAGFRDRLAAFAGAFAEWGALAQVVSWEGG